jgi:hypothetical protein
VAEIEYILGSVNTMRELYPPVELAISPVLNYRNVEVTLANDRDVIRHYTENSLLADGLNEFEVLVTEEDGVYRIKITATACKPDFLKKFAERHVLLMSPAAAYKAVAGMNLMKELGVWNPMSGYPVNNLPQKTIWNLFPPLGLNIVGQRGLLLMHYPPIQCVQEGTFLDCMTMFRWNTILQAVGIPSDEISFYRTIVDVNPVACQGSGESEYPNDYLPIMMASAFFSGPPERDYIRSMLELYVAPPGGGSDRFTLPLLVCGSDLYDPQAPGWFRVTYKDQLPLDANGTPATAILQTGAFKIRPDSTRETPYLCANHMIAAGVTGKCTNDPSTIPDIRKYEAQDLTAASFLYEYAKDPDLDPQEAKRRACQRWFGNDDGSGAPKPPAAGDQQILCALAQMDLFFAPTPKPHSVYTFEEAMARCAGANNQNNPCCPPIGPTSAS